MILALVLGCGAPPNEGVRARTCNGRADFCALPLDQTVMAKTHNSNAAEAYGYHPAAMNHFPAIATQLDDGIRALNLDVYPWDLELEPTEDPDPPLWMCHGFCALGHQRFSEGLLEIVDFLDDHPDEVLVIDFQIEASTERMAEEIVASGLASQAMVHEPGTPWPTLDALIEADTRVLFTGGPADGPAWWHPDAGTRFSTHWGTRSVDAFTCETDSPPSEHALFELDHTLSAPIASPELAATANTADVLLPRIADCEAEVGHPVNLISVDYYTIGDVMDAVRQ